MPDPKQTEFVQPLAYSIPAAALAIGLSRSSIYKLINRGKLEKRQIGGRVVIPAASLEQLLAA